jgi:hypothetical protein
MINSDEGIASFFSAGVITRANDDAPGRVSAL